MELEWTPSQSHKEEAFQQRAQEITSCNMRAPELGSASKIQVLKINLKIEKIEQYP